MTTVVRDEVESEYQFEVGLSGHDDFKSMSSVYVVDVTSLLTLFNLCKNNLSHGMSCTCLAKYSSSLLQSQFGRGDGV